MLWLALSVGKAILKLTDEDYAEHHLQDLVTARGGAYAANLEVAVYETEYAPGGINPRHLHPAAITFYVLSGAGVWQEEGKPPVTLRAGDSLFVPAGTIHSHWNPSTTDRLRFLEFIVAEKDKGRSIPQPPKD